MTKEERRIIAEKHFEAMQEEHIENLTRISVYNTKVYDDVILYNNDISVIDSTTEKAILTISTSEKNPCVLNFASFTRPGGGFIKGSIAQEEALCHVSNLYNILLKFKDRYDENYKKPSFISGLYDNWAIYSPDVLFEVSGEERLVNVITCPAPNYSVYKNTGGDEKLYNETLKSRIKYILDIAKDNEQEILIFGAFGCGVFENDPYKVAGYFKELLKEYKFKKVIFAIPNSNNCNYITFKKILNN